MSSRSDLLYLGHMLDYARRAHAKAAAVTRTEFFANEDLQVVVTHFIQTVGEAARRIPSETCARYPEIDWLRITGMRPQDRPRLFRGGSERRVGRGHQRSARSHRCPRKNHPARTTFGLTSTGPPSRSTFTTSPMAMSWSWGLPSARRSPLRTGTGGTMITPWPCIILPCWAQSMRSFSSGRSISERDW